MALTFDGLAGLLFPWLKKQTFESSPAIVRKRIGGIPIISILGAYSTALILFLLVDSLYNPAIAGPFGNATLIMTVAAFIIGVLAYLGMKTYHRWHGIDISLAFKEIPPE